MIGYFVFLSSFIAGVFVVWYLGRREYLNEEKLFDLVTILLIVGLVTSRIGFYFLPAGRAPLLELVNSSKSFSQIVSGVAWGDGFAPVIGGLFVAIVAVILIKRWSWPYWPTGGILALGFFTMVIFNQIAFAFIDASRLKIIYLVFASLGLLLMSLIYRFGGSFLLGIIKIQLNRIQGFVENRFKKS